MFNKNKYKNIVIVPKSKLKNEKIEINKIQNNSLLKKNNYEQIRDIVLENKKPLENIQNNNIKNVNNKFEIA